MVDLKECMSISYISLTNMGLCPYARLATALEDRSTAFIVHHSHTVPTTLSVLATISVVPFAHFSVEGSGIGAYRYHLSLTSRSL